MAVAKRQKAEGTITMRIPVQTRDLIDRAAASMEKSRSEFMIESARQRAVEMLLDQRVFHLDAEASDAFMQVMDQPPEPLAALRKLMASKAPWER